MQLKKLIKQNKKKIDKLTNKLSEELCDHCFCTEWGTQKINTAPWNLCEGAYCDETALDYLTELEEEKLNYFKERRF